MFCPKCGTDVADGKFCPSCGELVQRGALSNAEQVTEQAANFEQPVAPTVESEKKTEGDLPESKPPLSPGDFEVDHCTDSQSAIKICKFRNMSKGKKVFAAVVAAIVVIIIFAFVKSANSLTVPSKCDQGAVFNITLNQFNENFDKIFKEYSGKDFNIAEKWGNVVPVQTAIQDVSGKEFKTNTVVLQKSGIIISASEIDGKVSKVEATVSQDYIGKHRDEWLSINYIVLSACTGISLQEFNNIYQIINEGLADSCYVVVVKENVLYVLGYYGADDGSAASIAYSAQAVSDKFIKELEDGSGNCRVVYYDEKMHGKGGTYVVNTTQTEPQINEKAAIEALYSISAYPYGLEEAVRLGVYKDISVGEALERMFKNPVVECKADENAGVLVTVSGQYRASPMDSNYIYSGSITYRVKPDGTAMLQDDPDDVKQMMEYFAVTLGKR